MGGLYGSFCLLAGAMSRGFMKQLLCEEVKVRRKDVSKRQ